MSDGLNDDLSRMLGQLTPAQRELLLRRAERAGAVWEQERITARGGDGGTYPLSFAQQRLWFLDRLNPGSSFYNVAIGTRLIGRLDQDALFESLREIVRRHSILRSRFPVGDGEGAQIVSPEARFDCTVVDPSGYQRERREREAHRLAAAEAERPYSLETGPMLRVMLIALGEEEHVLVRVMHHIVCDGWSVGIFNRELAELYGSISSGASASLPPLPVQFADYAAWRRGELRDGKHDAGLEWWLDTLGGTDGILPIPADRPRPPVQTYEGALYSFSIPSGIRRSLDTFCDRSEVTPYMTLLAAYQTLLHRYADRTDIVVGSPIANRNRTETEQLIGFFANTLAMRSDFSESLSFIDLLARVKSMTVGAYAHQDVPLERIVDSLKLDRSLSYTPLVQAAFALQNTAGRELELPGLRSEPFPVRRTASIFDMTLYAAETGDGLSCTVEYSVDLFDEETIARMFVDYTTVLETVLAAPDTPVAALPVPSSIDGAVLRRKRRIAADGMTRGSIRPAAHAERLKAILALHPGVARAAVVEEEGGGRATAYVVPRGSRTRAGGAEEIHELPNGMAVYHLNRNETEFMFREIFEDRCYLKHGLILADGACVFDVGANIGLFSLFAAAACRAPRLFAFEPVLPLFEILKANVDRFGVSVTALNQGLADARRTETVSFYPRSSIMSGCYADRADDESMLRAFVANQRRLDVGGDGLSDAMEDDLIAGRLESRTLSCTFDTFSNVVRRFDVESVDLLKVDVEKSELDVLAGIADEDWTRIRQIVIEVHDMDGRLAAVTEMLRGRGYRTVVEQDPLFANTNIYSIYAGATVQHETARKSYAIPTRALRTPGAAGEPVTPETIAAFLAAHGVTAREMPRIEMAGGPPAGSADEIAASRAETAASSAEAAASSAETAASSAETAAAARESAEPPSVPDRLPLVVAATFTAEPITDLLAWFCERGGIDADIRFAPYNQVFQQLLDESSETARNTGVNIILLRFEDFVRDLATRDAPDPISALNESYGRLLGALRAAAARNPAPHLIALAPDLLSPDAGRYPRAVAERAGSLAERIGIDIAAAANLHLIDLRDCTEWYEIADPFDRRADSLAHMPFTPPFYAAVGAELARFVWACRKPPFKVIVTDCDNTLWKGVCGEDGPSGVAMAPGGSGGPYHELQAFLKDRMHSGMLLALCSKNNEDDVREVFDRHRDMVLGSDDIAAERINWLPKSRNIRDIAEELSVGLDSMIFLDDEPAEIAEVRSSCPDVLSLLLPEDPRRFASFLRHVWAFDRYGVTDVDRRRTGMYRAERERRRSLEAAPSMSDFLSDLDLTVSLRRPGAEDIPRMVQLSWRTNQFNMNGERRSAEEIDRFISNEQDGAFAVEVSDRYGYYGLVGVILYEGAGTEALLDTFLLSCRALGKGVEDAILKAMKERLASSAVSRFIARYKPTGRNTPFKQFLDRTGWRETSSTDGYAIHMLSASAVSDECDHVTILHDKRLDEAEETARHTAAAGKTERSGSGATAIDARHDETAPARTDAAGGSALPGVRLHHIGIAVPSLDEAGAFYRSLSFTCGAAVRDPLQHVDLVMCTGPSGERIELITSIDETSPCYRIIETNGGGPYHLGFNVPDCGSFLSHLENGGCRFTVLGRGAEAELFGGAAVTFIDVDGVGLIEAVEAGEAGPAKRSAPAANVIPQIATLDTEAAILFLRLIGFEPDPDAAGDRRMTTLRGPGFARIEILGPVEKESSEHAHLAKNGNAVYRIIIETDGTDRARHPSGGPHPTDAVTDARRASIAPYLLFRGRGDGAEADPDAAAWDVGAFNRDGIKHGEYLIPLEYHTGRRLMRIRTAKQRGTAAGKPHAAPQSETERKIAAIWETLIGAERIGIEDNFFKIGGNSMIAVQVITRILKEYGVELPLAAVFETPTVAGLSETVENYLWLANGGAKGETGGASDNETIEF